ncbi:MAG: hemolysin family protein, partial [Hungatella sp.]
MDDGHSPLSIIIFIGFVLLEAVFYGFGAAIQNVNVNNLEKEMGDGNRKAQKLLRIVNRPTGFVNTIQIMTNLIALITGAYIFGLWSRKLEMILDGMSSLSTTWLSLASMILIGILILVLLISFGIVIPKRCAAKNPEGWGYALQPLVSAIAVPMMPFIWMISGLSYVVLRCAGIDMNFKGENVTEEDIMSMVNEGHEQGVLEASEAEMITNIFEFTDKEASDIMTHRKNLVVIDGEMTLKDAVTFILKEGKNSRYPVYEKDIDDIVGILHMKDALICVENQENGDQPISRVAGLLREAHFIPETRNINSLFQEMQSQKIHMEIVVDEYGQTAGIVTMEDILEEIVGNILDEYDVDEEYVVPSGEDGYIMSGMTPLDEVAEILGIEFLEEEYGTYDTINGFLISKLDRIPEEDENFEVEQDGYLFKILSV